MSFKVRIKKNDLKALIPKLDTLFRQRDSEELGSAVTQEMKAMIAKGISPIRGEGRFPAYKDPKKYPGDKKSKRPVNLHLTGDFLRALSFKAVRSDQGFKTHIFYEGKEALKEAGHREGVHGQPKRPTLPQFNEQFSVKIQRIIREIYQRRIKEVLGKR